MKEQASGLHERTEVDPDYSQAKWWITHPHHHHERLEQHMPRRILSLSSDGAIHEGALTAIDNALRCDESAVSTADAFYIHGTQEFSHPANIASDFTKAAENSALGQATFLSPMCSVWVPFYRQASHPSSQLSHATLPCTYLTPILP